MPGFAISAVKTTLTELARISEPGLYDVELLNSGSVAVMLGFLRQGVSTEDSPCFSSAETARTQTVSDGESLANVPVVPKTLVLTGTGLPTLKDDGEGNLIEDRVQTTKLAEGSNGVTSAAATRTLTSAGATFATAGVRVGDQLVVSDGPDKGTYTIVTRNSETVLTIDQDWPEGGNTAAGYTVYPGPALAFGTVNYFSGLLGLDYPAGDVPAAKGTVLGTEQFPILLNPGDTLTVAIDGGGADTCTFDATPASREFVGPWTAAAGETLSVKVDGGATQQLTFSGAEATAAAYAASMAAGIDGIGAVTSADSLVAMIGILNELRTDYTAHLALLSSHIVAGGNSLAAAAATDLATAQTLANDIKAKLNLHEAAPSGLEEAITLLNEMKADYEAHRVLVAGSEHTNADGANNIVAADATNLASAYTLANDLKAKYEAHRAAVSELEEAITLANELRGDYEAHRIRIAGGTHTNADAVNALVAPVATDAATAFTLATDIKAKYAAHLTALSEEEEAYVILNELKADYNAHRILTDGAVHGGADAVNVVTAPDATSLGTANTLANDIKTQYEAHRVLVAGAVHANPDGTNVITSPDATTLGTLLTLTQELKDEFNDHIILQAGPVHGAADATNTCTSDDIGTASVHLTDDTANGIAAANATTMGTLKTLLNELKTDFNLHLASTVFHGAADAVNTTAADAVGAAAIHVTDDTTHTIAAADATTYATLVALAAELKTDYNAHIADAASHGAADAVNGVSSPNIGTAAVHQQDDTANGIAAPDASDLASLVTLVTELKADYNLHLAQAGVHVAADATNTITTDNTSIVVTTDEAGTGASFQVVSGSGSLLTKMGLTAATVSGAGDVAKISEVTFNEAKTRVEADVADCLGVSEGGAFRLVADGSAVGALSIIQVTGGTARTKFGFDALAHDGADAGAEQYVAAKWTSTSSVAAGYRVTRSLAVSPGDEIKLVALAQDAPGQVHVAISKAAV